MSRTALVLVALVTSLGCRTKEGSPPDAKAPNEDASAQTDPTPPAIAPVEVIPGGEPVGDTPPQAPFGENAWGFVQASSASGRIVLLRRFRGDRRPDFGHHGESSSAPELLAYDLVDQTVRELDDMIDIDPTRRWLLVLADQRVWLVDGDSGKWESLPAVDMSQDGNRCLYPRQAGFSIAGKRVGWVRDGARELQVRDLESGQEWTIASKARIWRGWPDDQDRGAVLLEVPADVAEWPLQNTSCACTWCGRFAMSYGFYGWSGPTFTPVHVAEDGSRGDGAPPDVSYDIHGPTRSGCRMHASEFDGESLERGPWQWNCQGAQ